MKSNKIAFYMSSLAKGGAQRVIINLAEHLIKQEIEVIIVTTKVEREEYPLPTGVKRILSDIPEQEGTNRFINFYKRVQKLRQIWKQEEPTLVISFVGKNNFMSILSSLLTPSRTIASVRGEPNAEYNSLVMKILAKSFMGLADGLILQTRQAQAFFPKWIQRKSIILPNPLNQEFVNTTVHRSPEIKTIISVGRVDANKNHRLLLDAFIRIANRYPELKLIIYGEGELRESLKKFAAESAYGTRIFLPGLSNDILADLQKADLFVLPSNTEGMPNALMEAMALGLPVISTDCPCGGPAELIKNHKNGILVPVGDVKAMEEAMIELVEDNSLAERIANHAFRIRTTHSPDIVNRQWIEYIQRYIK